MSVTPEPHDRTVPADFIPPKWVTGPKYTKRELEFLITKLDDANFRLRQQLFYCREQLRKETGQ